MYSSVVRYVANKGQYCDNNFQLMPSSIFKTKQIANGKVKWIRLSELYGKKKVTILR